MFFFRFFFQISKSYSYGPETQSEQIQKVMTSVDSTIAHTIVFEIIFFELRTWCSTNRV